MELRVLGQLEVTRDGAALDLGTRKQRILLAGLALRPNQVVSTDALIDLIWRADPPPAVTASLHGYVAALRRVLEPSRAARNRPQVLLTRPPGYELHLEADALDSSRFTRAAEAAHQELSGADPFAVPPHLSGEALDRLATDLASALALWRGAPYAELEDDPSATAERGRLDDLRLMALQDQARIQLALGRAAKVAADLAAATEHYPLREDLWGLRALALARDGRQADALATLRSARAVLDEELGIDPGPRLQQLEVAILRQDAAIHDSPFVTATVHPSGLHRSADAPSPQPPSPHPTSPPTASLATAGDRELVGRDSELEALLKLLTQAKSGVTQSALLVGEPGIGKTRLSQELAARAEAWGFVVLVGRCSQDEGAPPLWPWVGVLRALSQTWPQVSLPDLDRVDPLAPTPGAEPSSAAGHRFRTFDAVVRLLIEQSAKRPLLLVFDDLHWADASSLRLLRHLIDTADHGRLLIVATRRAHPEPSGALADLGEALARHHGLRLELTGLATEDVTALAKVTTGETPERSAALDLRERTGGNPFFILEVLRLSGGGRPADQHQTGVPAAVGDVIAARVGQLPTPTQQLLRTAAVIGRAIDLDLLVRLQAHQGGLMNGDRLNGEMLDGDVLDGLEPAIDAGLVIETADGALQFSHALVRDALYAAISPLRRQRRHADVAQVLEASAGDGHPLSEIARHWLLAGVGNAARAWRAAADAAAYASRLQAYDEAADLLATALTAQDGDPGAQPAERYDLLMARARACRACANSEDQWTATAAAIRLAHEADDIERVALAAITSSEGALWSNRADGVIDPPTIDALNLAARRLPPVDSALRCRVYLALSRELYWSAQPQEREAYAEQGLAMARRLADPQLRAWAAQTAFVAVLRPDTMEQRTDLAAESVACSRAAEDEESEVTGLFWQALVAGESGRLDDRRAAVRRALMLAERHRLRYLQVMLGSYEAPWLALEGRFAEAEQLYANTIRWGTHASFPFQDEAVAAARLCVDLWQGRGAHLLAGLLAMEATSPVDLSSPILLLRLRSGQRAEVEQHVAQRPLELHDDSFESPMLLALGAEAALVLGRPELAAQVYPLMASWAGRFASAGTGVPLGPVDSFLALAAATVGERELACEHADRALALCTRWQLEPVARWLTEHRRRADF